MSAKSKALSARLMAVQAVYQASLNEQDLRSAAQEYLEHRVSMHVEGEEIVEPDSVLFKKIVSGVAERREDLGGVIQANAKNGGAGFEALIKAILMCGSYELLAHTKIDAPIIINDYLNVAHGFFNESEVGLVNGILDKVAKSLRD
jgi:N utilization substance protein B